MSDIRTVPGYYVWAMPGKPVSVQMSLETIDQLSTEVMTGFGAIPKRGAEVGGILLGSIEGSTVRVEGFEAVPCSYKRGPSYLLTEADSAAFAEAVERWREIPGRDTYAVGMYRSNTREQATLSEEDREIFSRYFSQPSNVFLFVRPFATKVSQAGFLTVTSGRLDDHAALEFPFRRSDIEGTPAPRRALGEGRAPRGGPEQRIPRRRESPAFEPPAYPAEAPEEQQERTWAPEAEASPDASDWEKYYAGVQEAPKKKRSWLWLPVSLVFLLLGLALGFQTALSLYPERTTPDKNGARPLSLGLTVDHTEANLHIKWDRESPIIRNAPRGLLSIRDGAFSKQVDLDPAQLQNGSVIYRKLSNHVQFRLEIQPSPQVAVAQTAEWSER